MNIDDVVREFPITIEWADDEFIVVSKECNNAFGGGKTLILALNDFLTVVHEEYELLSEGNIDTYLWDHLQRLAKIEGIGDGIRTIPVEQEQPESDESGAFV